MSAGHFFVGLGAGIAILSVPVLMFTPGSPVPQHFVDWIMGPDPQPKAQITTQDAAVDRPLHGYQPGDPTPSAPTAPPTIEPLAMPTPKPTRQPLVNAPPLNTLRWQGTAVIHSDGVPVYVRRVAGVDSGDDPVIPDGSPVLVSSGPPLQIGPQQWRAIRGLDGVVGWVPTSQLAVDGEAPLATLVPAPTATPAAPQQQHGVIANTGGTGVVLRKSPNAADRTTSGLMDGMQVTVLEWSAGNIWIRVQAANGLSGWIPAQYVQAAG